MFEAHLCKHRHLRGGFDQFPGVAQAVGLNGNDRAPKAVLIVDLRQDFGHALFAQFGIRKDQGDLGLEDILVGANELDRRNRCPPSVPRDLQRDRKLPVHLIPTGLEIHRADQVLGHQITAHPGFPAEQMIVLDVLYAQRQVPLRGVVQVDHGAALAYQRLDGQR